MISALVLAIGMLFATFTQLRPSTDVAIGFGELCIAAWIGYLLIRSASRIDSSFAPAVQRLCVFWIVFAIAICVGTMAAFILDERNIRALFIHDVLAYTMMALMSLLGAFQAHAALRLRQTSWFLVSIGSAILAVQLLQGLSVISIPGTEVWYYERFTGWSTNSNQLGLLCLILSLLALHLVETAGRRTLRLMALCCAILPIVVGILTRSDAFLWALAISLLGLIGLKSWGLIRADSSGTSLRHAAAVLTVLTLPLLLAASVPGAQDALAIAQASTPGKSNSTKSAIERDIAYRTELWAQAAVRGAASGLLGLGPGPHLVRHGNLREPKLDALPDFEAHNTLIDLFLQGGALAVAVLLWLSTTTFLATLRAKFSILPMLTVATCVFGLTHFVIRHPIIWFTLMLALVAADARRGHNPKAAPRSIA